MACASVARPRSWGLRLPTPWNECSGALPPKLLSRLEHCYKRKPWIRFAQLGLFKTNNHCLLDYPRHPTRIRVLLAASVAMCKLTIPSSWLRPQSVPLASPLDLPAPLVLQLAPLALLSALQDGRSSLLVLVPCR